MSNHVITRPIRSLKFDINADSPPVGIHSPVTFFQSTSPSNTKPALLKPRPPVVHFFVCDNGNAKVKSYSDSFVQLMLNNGINVFTEIYSTHQPGFQVRAASLNTCADFFFQIHSKTASPGHVRLYIGGQPNRMTMTEAIGNIWARWRAKCGALSKDEVDVISPEKILTLLKDIAGIDPLILDFATIQMQAREAIERGTTLRPIIDKLHEYEQILNDGRRRVINSNLILSEWTKEPGERLQRIITLPIIQGLSEPLKGVLLLTIDQTSSKTKAILEVLEHHFEQTPPPKPKTFKESYDSSFHHKSGDGASWGLMLGSLDEQEVGSSQEIVSYGDQRPIDSVGNVRTPFFLDDF